MKHVLCPTECALQGGCITKPFTENKKPEGPSKGRVIAGFAGLSLSECAHTAVISQAPGALAKTHPMSCLKHLPNTHTASPSLPAALLLWRREAGGRRQHQGWDAAHLADAHLDLGWLLSPGSGVKQAAGHIRGRVLLPCLLPLSLAEGLRAAGCSTKSQCRQQRC